VKFHTLIFLVGRDSRAQQPTTTQRILRMEVQGAAWQPVAAPAQYPVDSQAKLLATPRQTDLAPTRAHSALRQQV